MKLNNPVQMAVIGAAHGIKGELRVKTFTGDPLALGDYGALYAKDGRAFEIEEIRLSGEVVVVRFKGLRDRTLAEAPPFAPTSARVPSTIYAAITPRYPQPAIGVR